MTQKSLYTFNYYHILLTDVFLYLGSSKNVELFNVRLILIDKGEKYNAKSRADEEGGS